MIDFRAAVCLSALWLSSGTAVGQDPPAETRRWNLSGDLDWSVSNAEDSSLNLTYYGNDLTRLLRLTVLVDFRLSRHTFVYVNFTSENADRPDLYGAFLRLAPWGGERLWLQAGKIPPAFGAFPERSYAVANPLIGYPLMYHHRTSLRPDSLPRDELELLGQRARGADSTFTGGGASYPRVGMPIISLLRWDSGATGFGRIGRLEYVLGVTNGTFSNPRVVDENDGKQIVGRGRFRFSPALEAGFSAARGPYLDRIVEESLEAADLEDFDQRVLGADVHFARGHLIFDAEAAWSRWTTPHLDPSLEAWSGFLEGRYRLRPGLYLAGRVDRMDFSRIGPERAPWDEPLTRLELGAGYSWERNTALKFSVQWNRFDEASELDETIAAIQVAVHF